MCEVSKESVANSWKYRTPILPIFTKKCLQGPGLGSHIFYKFAMDSYENSHIYQIWHDKSISEAYHTFCLNEKIEKSMTMVKRSIEFCWFKIYCKVEFFFFSCPTHGWSTYLAWMNVCVKWCTPGSWISI